MAVIKVRELAYGRLRAPDLDRMEEFLTHFGLSRAEANTQIEKVFGVLRRRQNDQGAFGYWAPETDEKISFNSVYVMDFLSAAKTAGFAPPADMFASGLRYLQKMVAREPSTLAEARTVAYGIYVLTREGVVTTNYVLNLQDYLDQHQTDIQPARSPGRRTDRGEPGDDQIGRQ